MVLQISYNNGESRIIHPHPTFFVPTPLDRFDKKSNSLKKHIATSSDKAEMLALDLGFRPHKIHLERSGIVEMDKVIHANEPIPYHPYKVDEKAIKKQLRAEHKHDAPMKTIMRATY